jgi:anthranilate synthase component 2
VKVYRNDHINCDQIEALAPHHLVISPGPCTPSQAGISIAAIQTFAGKIPILGVCLGHQSIGQAFGGKITKAQQIMHGKTSLIYHTGKGLFTGIENPFEATRYHSLVINQEAPECLEITAWTLSPQGDREAIMGVQHKTLPIIGVQFHPESILTLEGHALLKNFLTIE